MELRCWCGSPPPPPPPPGGGANVSTLVVWLWWRCLDDVEVTGRDCALRNGTTALLGVGCLERIGSEFVCEAGGSVVWGGWFRMVFQCRSLSLSPELDGVDDGGMCGGMWEVRRVVLFGERSLALLAAAVEEEWEFEWVLVLDDETDSCMASRRFFKL